MKHKTGTRNQWLAAAAQVAGGGEGAHQAR